MVVRHTYRAQVTGVDDRFRDKVPALLSLTRHAYRIRHSADREAMRGSTGKDIQTSSHKEGLAPRIHAGTCTHTYTPGAGHDGVSAVPRDP